MSKTDVEHRPIYCMEHCKDDKLFAFQIPTHCSTCGNDLAYSDFHLPPFRIPYPFIGAKDSPCSVVIKPVNGSFLRNYKTSDNLHIGLTSSSGIVYEYNYDGLRKDKTAGWTQCISIKEVLFCKDTFNDDVIKHYWDCLLAELFCMSHCNGWNGQSYDESNHNCYSFILHFLQILHQRITNDESFTKKRTTEDKQQLQLCDFDSISSRLKFSNTFLIDKTKSAAKYIALYRKLVVKDEQGQGK